MIIVMARLFVQNGKKQDLFALANKGLIAATRAEKGCVSYALLDDPADEASCLFVEEWSDIEALRKHTQTPHMAEWKQQTADILTGRSVKLYKGELTSL